MIAESTSGRDTILTAKGVCTWITKEPFANLSQEEVSNLIPINQSSYSKIERDIQEPNLEQLRRICQILKLDPSYLLMLDKYESADNNDLLFAKEIKKAYDRIYKSYN